MEKIVVENLCFEYYNSNFKLKNINLKIKSGEFVLLTGPSGSGKSTLAYCFSGIIPHCIKNGEMKGRVIIDGIDTREIPLNELVKKVGIVFQNPESQIFGMSVEEDIAFGLENLCYPREKIIKRVENILSFLELKKLREESPDCLSGGQKQRLVIGSVLAMEPEILVLDEPASNLDPQGTKMILSTLSSLKNMGKTIILIERKVEYILPFIDRVIAMNDGEIIANSDPRDFFKNKKLVEKINVHPPQIIRLYYKLIEKNMKLNYLPLTIEEFVSVLYGTYH